MKTAQNKDELKIEKCLAKVAKKVAEKMADTRCMYIYHQPVMPEELKKER